MGRVPEDFRDILLEIIGRELSANPFPRGKIIKRLHGFRIPTYELRVQVRDQSHRVVYRLEGRRVLIVMIAPRKELDRRLGRMR